MERIIDFKAKLDARVRQNEELASSVERALLRVGILNHAIEEMWGEGSDNGEIASTLRHAADELTKT